jgi:quercetin dioxygenase-like cupin family protein
VTATFIDTFKLPRKSSPQGDYREVLNNDLVGAKNVVATVRWLKNGQTYKAAAQGKHQMIYLLKGDGTIRLENKDYEVGKGAGVYLAPNEGASVTARGAELQLFHLQVRPVPQNWQDV